MSDVVCWAQYGDSEVDAQRDVERLRGGDDPSARIVSCTVWVDRKRAALLLAELAEYLGKVANNPGHDEDFSIDVYGYTVPEDE